MGVEYTVACKKCKVKRDLHKMKIRTVVDMADAVKFSEELECKDDLYREGLLLSFMAKHCHCDSIVYFSENDEVLEEECSEFETDGTFWGGA